MENLIWFSAPGAVLAIAIICTNPGLVKTDVSGFLAAVAVPVLGFGIHQFYRLLFEMTGGFARKSRPALKHIQNVIAPENGIENCDREKAFLIWETTFYSDEFPSSFRDHNRGAWHYILSFQSTALAAVLGASWIGVSYCIGSRPSHPAEFVLGEVAAGIVFALKGHYTYQSLMKQELASTFAWYSLFAKTSEALQEMPDSFNGSMKSAAHK